LQEKDTHNNPELEDIAALPRDGRVIGLDIGTKRIGVAVSDSAQTIARPLLKIERQSWKKLNSEILRILDEFDAAALVIGLPLEFDGRESEMSREVRRTAEKLSYSTRIPIFLQDERATSYEARGRLWQRGLSGRNVGAMVDSEAAAIILSDFLDRLAAARRTI
jgi:putative holliday junction resolvase